MGGLRFTCPKHAREIDSGIEMDDETFERLSNDRVDVFCPLCNSVHDYQLADGRLDKKRTP